MKEPKRTQDFSEGKDTKAQRDDWKAEERDNRQAGAVTEEPGESEVWKGSQKDTQSLPHIQRGSPEPQEGMDDSSIP